MGRSARRCVAGLAKLFAELAIQSTTRGPARSTAVAPGGRAHPEVGPAGARERGGRGKTVIERHLEHASIWDGEQDARRALEAQALDEPEERLAGHDAKDAVEVKRRECRHARQGRERQGLAEMRADVIDDTVDTPLVLAAVVARHRRDRARVVAAPARCPADGSWEAARSRAVSRSLRTFATSWRRTGRPVGAAAGGRIADTSLRPSHAR